jgi:cytochrome b involved in lipid metabolism
MKHLGIYGLIFTLLTVTIIFSGCVSDNAVDLTDKNVPVNSTNNSSNGKYNLEEISKHSTADNCWTAINGKVYDITKFITLGEHKPIIVQGCGIDSTQMYVEKHDSEQDKILFNYYIGELN